MAASLSACLIVRDEEDRLPACLASVGFCDEIVVVDGGSRDRTREIARAAGATVLENPWPGFSAQRNVALDHASSDWVLEIDADERITSPLAEEIAAFLAAPPDGFDMTAIPKVEVFLGAGLRPSARYPGYRLRLFRRGAYRHDEGRTVHEGLWPAGPVWPLHGEFEHDLAADWCEALNDMWAYARLEAAQTARPSSPRPYVVGLVVRPLVKVAYRLVVLGGWRDGWRGGVKVALDSVSDALVWARVALRSTKAGPGKAAGGHFGKQARHQGPARILALAAGAHGTRAAAAWLADAERAGADVGLLTNAPHAVSAGRHVRPLGSVGPFSLARALDAEWQLRSVDAVLPWGPGPARLLRLAPPNLRAPHPPLSPDEVPAAAVAAVGARTR